MTQLLGILNLTPDSFSDGGTFMAPDAALSHAQALLDDGADWIDVGAESTRPGAVLLSPEAEWVRLAPFLGGFAALPRVSLDTRHAETARKALAMGVAIINDQGGLHTPAMIDVIAASTCRVIVMHALSLPADPGHVWAADMDPVAEILRWKADMIQRVQQAGIAPERLIFDPGLGFGKTAEQSMALVERAGELVQSGGAWLYGHSRKSFLTLVTDAPAAGRDAATIAISKQLVAAGVQYLRVHDVKGHRAWLK